MMHAINFDCEFRIKIATIDLRRGAIRLIVANLDKIWDNISQYS